MDNKRSLTFTIFKWTLVTVIFVESVFTVIHSLHSTTESHLGTLLPYFAGLEAIAATLLLIRQTLKIGGVTLLIIFSAALVIHGPAQQLPLFVYAAGVIFLMANGNAYASGHERSNNDNIPQE